MGFNRCNVDNFRNACNDSCSSPQSFAIFSSNVDFVDYLESVRFSEETITRQGGITPIRIDGNGNIRIEECGIYNINYRLLLGSMSSWALFRVDPNNGSDVLIPSSFASNQHSPDVLMMQAYANNDNEFLTFNIPVAITSPTTIKLKNITGDMLGRAGVDRTGVVREQDGKMVKIVSKNNTTSGIPFPGVVLSVFRMF